MRVLVTRPRPDAMVTARLLEDAGHKVLVAPLMKTVPVAPPDGFPGPDLQAWLVTSANGVRALAGATPDRSTPVFAVGDASANAARDCGFRTVESANGDVDALADLVRRALDPKGGRLVHAVGSVTAGNLAGDLSRAGFEVSPAVLYEAQASETLPHAIGSALRRAELDGVLIYSPRTARIFARLIADAGLDVELDNVAAFGLSQAVSDVLSGLRFSTVRTAREPTQDALLRELEAYSRETP